MNPYNTDNISASAEVQLAKVASVLIEDQLCYPKFTCVHLIFPGAEQLKRNLARYRQKENVIHLFDNANNFD